MITTAAMTRIAPASALPRENVPRYRALPPIFHIVLTQAVRHRRRGAITDDVFSAQLRRIAKEELEPRGLELMMRELSSGMTRFLIKAKNTGTV